MWLLTALLSVVFVKLEIWRLERIYNLPLKGLNPNVQTYTIMIDGLFRRGLIDEASPLFTEMEENGCLVRTTH